jgi:hypothetical protein
VCACASGFGWEMRSADFPRHDSSPQRGLHARRETVWDFSFAPCQALMLYDSRFAIRNFRTARAEYFCDHLVRGRPIPHPRQWRSNRQHRSRRRQRSNDRAGCGQPCREWAELPLAFVTRASLWTGGCICCAAACGVKAPIVHYDAKAKGVDAKKESRFPFGRSPASSRSRARPSRRWGGRRKTTTGRP